MLGASFPLPVLFERKLAVVLPQEVEEPLVVARFHVEQAEDDLVVAARLLEALVDEIANVAARDLAVHVQRVHRRPERLAILNQLRIEIVGDGAAALAARPDGHLRRRAELVRQIVDLDRKSTRLNSSHITISYA